MFINLTSGKSRREMQVFPRRRPSSSWPATLPASLPSSWGSKYLASGFQRLCCYDLSQREQITWTNSIINEKFTSWRDRANRFASWGTSGSASLFQSWDSLVTQTKNYQCPASGSTLQIISQPTSAAPGLSSHKEQNQPPGNVVMTFPNPSLILRIFTSRMRSRTNLLCFVSWPWRNGHN